MRKIYLCSRQSCRLLIALCSLFICIPLNAADFGLLVSQYVEAGNQEISDFKYQANILPRFSLPLNDYSNLFVSAGITFTVEEDFYFIPELLQTTFSYRSGNWGISAGRMQYTDPLGYVAAGLFDGVQFSLNSTSGILRVGAWYTGLLYKKNAIITVTAGDQALYDSPVDYDDFFNTYFASKRFLASLDWEHPSLAELLNLKAAVTVQTDLTDAEQKYNSQYLTLKAIIPVKSFTFELGGSLETAQSEDFNIAFAWDFGIFLTLPSVFHSRLALTGHFTSGHTDGIVGVFVPVTGKLYGNVLKAKLSGISVLSLNYTARFTEALGMSLTASHFVRSDQGTYTAYPVNIADNNGYSLGTELFARFVWSPFSDLQFNFGGGAFLPSLGDVNPDEEIGWRVELTVIFSVY